MKKFGSMMKLISQIKY